MSVRQLAVVLVVIATTPGLAEAQGLARVPIWLSEAKTVAWTVWTWISGTARVAPIAFPADIRNATPSTPDRGLAEIRDSGSLSWAQQYPVNTTGRKPPEENNGILARTRAVGAKSESPCNLRQDCVPRVVLAEGSIAFSLDCAGEKVSLKIPAITGTRPVGTPLPSGARDAVEALFWLSIRNGTDPTWFDAYLARFPVGEFRELAGIRLKALRTVADDGPRLSDREVGRTGRFTSSEGSSPAPRFGADWQRTFPVKCGPLSLEVSVVSGQVKLTLFGGVLSIGLDGQVTLSVKYGIVSFEAPVGVPSISSAAAPLDAVFWDSIAKNSDPAGFEAYLRQFPNGAFRAAAHLNLLALDALRQTLLTSPPGKDVCRGVTRTATGLSRSAVGSILPL